MKKFADFQNILWYNQIFCFKTKITLFFLFYLIQFVFSFTFFFRLLNNFCKAEINCGWRASKFTSVLPFFCICRSLLHTPFCICSNNLLDGMSPVCSIETDDVDVFGSPAAPYWSQWRTAQEIFFHCGLGVLSTPSTDKD